MVPSVAMLGGRIQRIPGPAFDLYQAKRLGKLGAIAPLVALERWMQARGIPAIARHRATRDVVAFHPWRPGLVDCGQVPTAEESAELARLGWTADGPVELEGVVRRAMLDFAALQNPWELEQLLLRVAARRPRTVLEIGTSAGGLLFAIAQVAAPDATLVSIDLPERTDSAELAAAMPQLLASLAQPTQVLHAVRDRSTIHGVRADVIALLGGRPLELLIIDADHTYGGVRADHEMYGGLVAPGGLIAFHDVAIRPDNSGRGYDVGLYWDELCLRHGAALETIVDPDGEPGLLARRRPVAFGWGLVAV